MAAANEGGAVDQQGPSEPATAPAAPLAEEPVKVRSPEDDVRAQLEGTQWLLDLTALSATGKAKPQKDTVNFESQKVSSERLLKAGYPQSNYTLTIGGDGIPVWETMQTKEGEGVVFWRGELHGSIMRGVLSKHPVEGAAEDFSFVGREAGGKAIGSNGQQSLDAILATTGAEASPPSARP